MDSLKLKTEALCWLRFVRRMEVVCTEVGQWSADVLGLSKDLAIEVEVKTTISDLKADFVRKARKHYVYQNAENLTQFIPNLFYFLVPEKMVDTAVTIVEEKGPKLGVAYYQADGKLPYGQNIVVKRRPTRLHSRSPNEDALRMATLRLSSEVCGLKILQDKWFREVNQTIRGLNESVIQALDKVTEAAPQEEPKETP